MISLVSCVPACACVMSDSPTASGEHVVLMGIVLANAFPAFALCVLAVCVEQWRGTRGMRRQGEPAMLSVV